MRICDGDAVDDAEPCHLVLPVAVGHPSPARDERRMPGVTAGSRRRHRPAARYHRCWSTRPRRPRRCRGAAVEVHGELRPRSDRDEVRLGDDIPRGRPRAEEARVAVHGGAHPPGEAVLRVRLDRDILPDVPPARVEAHERVVVARERSLAGAVSMPQFGVHAHVPPVPSPIASACSKLGLATRFGLTIRPCRSICIRIR